MKAILSLVRKDHKRDNDGTWSWIMVLSFAGTLDLDFETGALTEDQVNAIYEFVSAHGLGVVSAGSGAPGQPFANEPWIQLYPSTIIVSQRGGLDV